MATSSSIIGVSSVYQTNPSIDHSKRPTLIHFSTAYNPFRAFSHSTRLKSTSRASNSFVASAVFTPNSSVLSEEAFKGLGPFGKGGVDVSESEYEESEGELGENETGNVDELDVSKLGLSQRLVDTLEKRGITQLFPIQRAVLVPALEGRDIIARAKTGTGKTLAFGIPIIKGLDVAEQERGSLRRGRLPKQSALSRGVDVVVGTPGRLIDLINNNSLKLGEVKYLVLDEADQMLAVGFEEDVEVILEQVGDREEKLAEGIKLYAIPTTATSKRTILGDLVTVYAKGGKAIVFTQTKRDADEVSLALTNSIPSEALHGDISQHQRERTLNGFRQGKFTVLVATDVAARGLDIPNVDLVIHYELPNDPETFVHRSGRTGRAGKEGTAVLMFTSSQRRTVKSLERDVGCKFEFIGPPSVQEVLESSAEQVVATLSAVHPESVNHGFLSDVYSAAADEIGKIHIIADEKGAVFDLPEEIAKELLNKELPPGNTIAKIAKLPPLQDDGPPSDYYGRFSNSDRRSDRRPQRGSMDRGGFRSSRDWSDDSGLESGFKRGGRSGRSENRWSGGSSRSSGSDWLIGDRRSSRSPSFGGKDSRSFGGACFNCGRPGHRASECPSKKDY
ncbi:hypothetical protein DH2020_026755 [Rehmannia glutinosa]|uniref:RNA helicase n=1 Tax=Rehmannia glutinosa TaxID=99300 RepID=A0ABR0W030_REHGL